MNEDSQDPRRAHARISLRLGKDSDLLLACDGVTVTLLHPQWWRPGRIGVANIKDISRGGVGLISSSPLKPGQVVLLGLDELNLRVQISHGRKIQGPLHFYGASYQDVSDRELLSAMKWIQAKRRLYRFAKDKPFARTTMEGNSPS